MSSPKSSGPRLPDFWSKLPLRLLILAGFSLLLVGWFRYELTYLLWGSTLCLLGMYFTVGILLLPLFIPLRSQQIRGRWTYLPTLPVQTPVFEVETKLSGLPLPGFCWILRFRSSCGPREILASWRLPEGSSTGSLILAPQRGLFPQGSWELSLEDVWGLNQKKFELPWPGDLILGIQGPSGALNRESQSPEGLLIHPSGRRIKDELLDVRPYFPGDDLRRIHWKLLAHSQELFLRKPEDRPPPRGGYFWWFDPWWPWDKEQGMDYLDLRLSLFVGAVNEVISQGFTVTLGSPSHPQDILIDQVDSSKLIEWTAKVQPSSEAYSVQSIWKNRGTLFCIPRSPQEQHFSDRLLCPWLGADFLKFQNEGWWQNQNSFERKRVRIWTRISNQYKNWMREDS